jgi:hypothetical protein
MHYYDHTLLVLIFHDLENVTTALHLESEHPGNGTVGWSQSVKVKMIGLLGYSLI